VQYVLKNLQGKVHPAGLAETVASWNGPRRRVDEGGILTRKSGLHYDGTLLPDGRLVCVPDATKLG